MTATENSYLKGPGHCCLCDGTIEPEGIEPCGLWIYTNAYAPRHEQKEQFFICHSHCFQQLPGVYMLVILDPDHPTIGELEAEAAEAGELTSSEIEAAAAEFLKQKSSDKT
jgi:hypothetical protein